MLILPWQRRTKLRLSTINSRLVAVKTRHVVRSSNLSASRCEYPTEEAAIFTLFDDIAGVVVGIRCVEGLALAVGVGDVDAEPVVA
jgi:hypothetical protein